MSEAIRPEDHALQWEELRFNALFNNATLGIVVANHQGDILLANPFAEKQFGYSSKELQGLKVEALIPEHFHQIHQMHRNHYVDHPVSRPMGLGLDLFARRKDGSIFPVEISLSPYHTPQGMQVIAFIVDVSLRKQIEETLRRKQRELEQYAEELEASNKELENFAYISSHDLQEPLRKIQAFADRIRGMDGERLSKQGLDYFNRIQQAAARMQRLINDLLNFSRITSSAKTFIRTDLQEVLRDVLDDLQVTIESTKAEIHADALPVIQAVPTQMRQLFQNLIGNALKFRRPDQPLELRITMEIELGKMAQDRMLVLHFKDNGKGFSDRYADKIFNIFQRLDHNGSEGSGIGLAVCKKIVQQHGGTITAHGEPGMGAEFVVTLPFRATPTEASN